MAYYIKNLDFTLEKKSFSVIQSNTEQRTRKHFLKDIRKLKNLKLFQLFYNDFYNNLDNVLF